MILHLQSVNYFALPLSRDLVIAGKTLNERSGFFITLVNEEGVQGIGEIAPLAGFHHETLDDCIALIRQHRNLLSAIPIKTQSLNKCEAFLHELFRTLDPFKALPSVHFGLAMAAINLWAEAHNTHPANVLSPTPLTTLPINGLVTSTCDHWHQDVRQLVDAGHSVIKLKVGRSELQKEAHALRALQDRYGTPTAYVLDGNRAWSLDEATTFFEHITTDSIRYGEELLQDPHNLATLQNRVAVIMALDETLFEYEKHATLIQGWQGNVILKPDRISGSIENCLALAYDAHHRGADAIISSAFNSAIGLSFLVQLAAALQCPHAGLDTGQWFAEEGTDQRFGVSAGSINVDTCWINDLNAFIPYLENTFSP